MARQNTSGRESGSTATKNVPGNQTPNTPEVNESQIARLRVDQLRDRLRRRGVTGTADMRKGELVDALVQALREGRKTTRSRAGSTSRDGAGAGSRSGSGSRGSGSSSGPGRAGAGGRARGGSAARGRPAGKEQPGNQTPNTPDVNESEIARLKVDQLRDRLRRRGITGTGEMRKAELVDALVGALKEGRSTARVSGRGGSKGSVERGGSGRTTTSTTSFRTGSAAGRSTNGGSRGRRSGEQQPGSQPANNELAHLEVDELRYLLRRRAVAGTSKMRKGQLVEALITALREGRRPEGDERDAARVPRPRTAPDDIEDAHLQPVRSSGSSDGEPTGSGPSVSAETADRVLTDLVPAEMEPVDEVVTPEGTVITGGATTAAVATPPLPTTDDR